MVKIKNSRAHFYDVILYTALFACILGLASGEVEQVSRDRRMRITVHAINEGSPFVVDPTYVNALNARLGTDIAPLALKGAANLYFLSSTTSWNRLYDYESEMGTVETFLESSGRSWAFLSFKAGTVGVTRCEALILSSGNTQILPFSPPGSNVTTADGIVGRLSTSAVGDVVAKTGCFSNLQGGLGRVAGVVSFSSANLGPGVISSSDQFYMLLFKA